MLNRVLVAGCTFVLLAGMAIGQAREAIEDVISGQLQAFNDRDVDEAFSYASPTIQGIFGAPDNFGLMVERGFPMVWDNADVRFLAAQELNGVTLQRIMLRDPQDVLHTLEYEMIETADGWLINGVQLVAPDVAA